MASVAHCRGGDAAVVQSLSCVRLFETSWAIARQAPPASSLRCQTQTAWYIRPNLLLVLYPFTFVSHCFPIYNNSFLSSRDVHIFLYLLAFCLKLFCYHLLGKFNLSIMTCAWHSLKYFKAELDFHPLFRWISSLTSSFVVITRTLFYLHWFSLPTHSYPTYWI